MANDVMNNLLSQYTGNIQADPRVFGQDVMSYDQFASPFNEFINQASNELLTPDFLRYQYNPYVKQTQDSLTNMNQNIGLSGGWRDAGSKVALNDAAEQGQLGEEQLRTGFNNQLMQTQDQFANQWTQPLYNSNLSSFYNAPWRNIDTGTPQPTSTSSTGFQPTPVQPTMASVPATSNLSGQYANGGNITNFLKQYKM